LVTKRPVRDDGWRLPDELWAKMAPLLPERPRHPLGCHNPRVPDRAAMDAIFFVPRTGCRWNALGATGICSSSSAHRRFLEWAGAGVLAAFRRQGLLAYDEVAGIDCSGAALPRAGARRCRGQGGEPRRGSRVGGKTGPNPTDRGKRGSKRSLLTDGRGVPLGLALAGANRNDHQLMRETVETIPVVRPTPTPEQPQGLCLDKGYDHDEPRALAAAFGFTLHLRTRGEEIAAKRHAGAKARRWVVERTHSWLNRSRRILIRWEKRPDAYLAMLHSALGLIAWRHASLPG
jgi:transposase